MRVRHLTAANNVAVDGSLIDATAVRHGLIVAGRVSALAGLVDPLTHLNADFTDHGLEQCTVVERLEVGAPACFENDGFRLAWAADSAYEPLGRVDLTARLRDWRAARSSPQPTAFAETPPRPRKGDDVGADLERPDVVGRGSRVATDSRAAPRVGG
jgi:hypothetical protein